MQRPEQPVQIAIANYLRWRGFLFTAPDAGINVKSERMRAIYKSMGRMAGVPDLLVWIPGGTLGIEVKKPKVMNYSFKTHKMVVASAAGRQSEGQKSFEERVKKIPGHHYIVATSVNEVAEYIEKNKIIPY